MTSTDQPTTLRSLAGLPLGPPPLATATVVVIDAQEEYGATGGLPLVGIDAAVENIARLLTEARRVGAPIVHVAHQGRPGGLFDPGDGGPILDPLRPRGDEPVVDKTLPTSFAGTDLLDRLGGTAKRPLGFAGFMTHMCVSSTARAALDLGFETTVVADATATRDLPSASGGPIVAAALVHEAALAALADRFAVVCDTAGALGSV